MDVIFGYPPWIDKSPSLLSMTVSPQIFEQSPFLFSNRTLRGLVVCARAGDRRGALLRQVPRLHPGAEGQRGGGHGRRHQDHHRHGQEQEAGARQADHLPPGHPHAGPGDRRDPPGGVHLPDLLLLGRRHLRPRVCLYRHQPQWDARVPRLPLSQEKNGENHEEQTRYM